MSNLHFLEAVFKLIAAVISLAGILLSAIPRKKQAQEVESILEQVRRSNLKTEEKKALQEQIGRYERQVRFGKVATITLLAILLVASSVMLITTPAGHAAVSAYLAKRDPDVFSHSADGTYDIARIIGSRAALEQETDFVEVLATTRSTFDLMTTGGGVFHAYQDVFEQTANRGVRIRLLLLDPGPASDSFYDESVLLGESAEGRRLEREKAIATERELQKMRDRLPTHASIELRWLRRPMVKLMWVRDGRMTERGIAHVTWLSYLGGAREVSARAGRFGPALVTVVQEEFDLLWSTAALSRSDATN